VHPKLGAPDDVSAIEPPIWKYRQIEISFREDRVLMIAVREHADAETVTKMLDEAGVTYQPIEALTYDDQIAYVVGGSGVQVTLDGAHAVARGFAT
jgi:hypothetical protein